MLHSLSVHNFIVIRSLHLDFRAGLSLFTGETGAGKSILLDALQLILGGKTQPNMVRGDALYATITAEFSSTTLGFEGRGFLAEHALPLDETLHLKRVIYPDGRSKGFINDVPCTLPVLKHLGSFLIEIHGQFDHLLAPSSHQGVLDAFGRVDDALKATHDTYHQWKESVTALNDLEAQHAKAAERLEWVERAFHELEALQPLEGEEDTLTEKRTSLMAFERYRELLNGLQTTLMGSSSLLDVTQGAYRSFIKKKGDLVGLDRLETALEATLQALENMEAEVHAFEAEFGGNDPEELELIEGRLYKLRALALKYQVDADDLPALMMRLKEEREHFQSYGTERQALDKRVAIHKEAYVTCATVLRGARQKTATILETKVMADLVPLKLPHARFQVTLQPLGESDWTASGMERIEFWVSTNPGVPLGPFAQVASGGERSRIMLVLKTILKEQHPVPTMIFDEIDSGVGGAVAIAMGEKLKNLSKNLQILAITHSPQLAAYGDHHFYVHKTQTVDATETSVTLLETETARLEEIARMLAGNNVTDEARAAAQELIKEGQYV